jgi:hypothetical protein
MKNYPVLEEFGGILGYNTMAVFKLSNSIVGSLHFGASVNKVAATSRLEVYGDNTDVLHASWFDKIRHYKNDEVKEIVLDPSGTRAWGHRQLDTHFINSILGREKPKASIDDAIKAQEIAGKIVFSSNLADTNIRNKNNTANHSNLISVSKQA